MGRSPANRSDDGLFRILNPSLSVPIFLSLCLTCVSLWRAWPDTIDDAHITFRYVENWLAGAGLTFNPGSPPVEGFSNPLFLFALAPFTWMGIRPEAAAFVLGLLSFGLCVLAGAGLVRALGGTNFGSTLAAVAVLCHFPLLYYSVTGLETGFYAALIAAALWRYILAQNRVDGPGALLWLLVALTRPEGILYPALLGLAELPAAAVSLRPADFRRRPEWGSVLWLLGVALAFGTFLIWRRAYFGAWLPNTFLAKPPGSADLAPGNNPIWVAAGYCLGFLGQLGILLPLGALAALRHCRERSFRVLWLAIAGSILFVFYAGGDWMPFSRFLLPVAVLWIAAGAKEIDDLRIAVGCPAFSHNLGRIILWTAAFSAAAGPAVLLTESWTRRNLYPFHVLNSSTCRAAAENMRREFGTKSKIVAYRIGALGRFSGMTVVDLFGLVDRDIASVIADHPNYHPSARMGHDLPGIKAVVKAYQPDLILVLEPPTFFPERVTLYDANFRLRGSYVLGSDQVWQLYRRED